MKYNYKTLVKAEMVLRGVTQAQMAQDLGMAESWVSQGLSGRSKSASKVIFSNLHLWGLNTLEIETAYAIEHGILDVSGIEERHIRSLVDAALVFKRNKTRTE